MERRRDKAACGRLGIYSVGCAARTSGKEQVGEKQRAEKWGMVRICCDVPSLALCLCLFLSRIYFHTHFQIALCCVLPHARAWISKENRQDLVLEELISLSVPLMPTWKMTRIAFPSFPSRGSSNLAQGRPSTYTCERMNYSVSSILSNQGQKGRTARPRSQS